MSGDGQACLRLVRARIAGGMSVQSIRWMINPFGCDSAQGSASMT